MASSSNTPMNPFLGQATSEKLTKGNHALWKAQILAVVRGARLEDHLTGATKAPAQKITQGDKEIDNPLYGQWIAIDQQVLGYLLLNMSRDALLQVATSKTAAEAWAFLEATFSSIKKARAVNTRIALSTTRKGDITISEYVGKMRALADEMASAGKPLDDEDIISYIIAGLDDEYNPVVTTLVARSDSVSVAEAYAQLLNFEQRMHLLHGEPSQQHSAHMANRGRGSQRGRGGRTGGRTTRGRGRNNPGPPRQNSGSYNNDKGPRCQLCKKKGHTVMDCWHRFDENFVPDDRFAGTISNSYGVDTNWYFDTGATDHVTGELEKLTVRDKYKGGDQVHTASGSGMEIAHIGHSVIKTPYRNLHLKNILHAPQATKSLASVHKLAADNFAFLEFHSNFFVIKDKVTKKVLLKGPCHRGLYPLSSSSLPSSPIKQAYGVSKPSLATWHSRLGHPSSPIVEKVVSLFNLPHCIEKNKQSVCDACQRAKSHQLPYLKSNSVSSHPLELIFSDVWGPAPMSIGGKKILC
jgi:hypothetical protein